MGLSRRVWPMHLLLLSAILAPTLVAVWFIRAAISNESLAVRQRLTEAYRSQLYNLTGLVGASWVQRLDRIDTLANSLSAKEMFARTLEEGLADSIIVHRDSTGVSYPFRRADRSIGDPTDSHLGRRFRALADEIKINFESGELDTAITLLLNLIDEGELVTSKDETGGYPALSLMLLALEATDDVVDPRVVRVAERLATAINDYSTFTMPSSQRLFLIRRFQNRFPNQYAFPTRKAEVLANLAKEAGLADARENTLVRSSLEKLWQVTSPDKRVTALYSSDFLQREFEAITADRVPLQDIEVVWFEPGETQGTQPFVSTSLGEYLPGWTVALNLKNEQSLTVPIEQRVALYAALGAAMISASVLVSLFIARTVQRNIDSALLKDNLVATVSHELKTPVSSVRLLVDTLLAEPELDEKRTREYLELISRENARLSHVVDNFLTFSRMARGKHRFAHRPADAREIAEDSMQAIRDRVKVRQEAFVMDVQDELPELVADSEALKIAIVNLLENAFKYSDEPHRVRLRVAADNGSLTFSVRDNGLGIDGRERRKITDRFYRGSRALARKAGGIGLGLSIVQSIVAEHNGRLVVESEPDVGSTFSIVLPATAASGISDDGVE